MRHLKVPLLSGIPCDVPLELILLNIVVWEVPLDLLNHIRGYWYLILHTEFDRPLPLICINQQWYRLLRLVVLHEVLRNGT